MRKGTKCFAIALQRSVRNIATGGVKKLSHG
jgi:hypothetical protein